jgi:cellobiose phosphorylase
MIREGHRYFYLRDHDSGTLWSPGWHPVQAPLDEYQCIHGLGYSIVHAKKEGIEAKLRWFVPEEDPCEIWTVTITNRRDREAHLSFYTFVDWLLQGYPSYSDYYSWIWGEYYEDIHAVQGCNRAIERPHEVFDGFVASDLKPSGFDTSRRRFLGNFGPINYPEAIRDGKCRNSLACNEKLVGVLEHSAALKPGETRTFNLFIGASSGYEMTKAIVTRLSDSAVVAQEFEALKERNREMVERIKVSTPDEHLNHLINSWVKQQIQIYADVGPVLRWTHAARLAASG